jgi:hypothetical protein
MLRRSASWKSYILKNYPKIFLKYNMKKITTSQKICRYNFLAI